MANHELQSVFRQHATNSTRFFRAESSFNENISEKVSLIGLAFIARHKKTNEMRETERVHKLNSTVNKNYLQHVGLVSSRQR